jgi:L-fucose mutarotase
MLLGLDPVLSPDLLHALAAMGHGDRLALVDANYPATRGRRLIQLPGIDMPRALQAVLSVFPIDTFIPEPCAVMQVVGEPDARPPVQAEMNAVLASHGAKPAASLERHAFYAAAETAYAMQRRPAAGAASTGTAAPGSRPAAAAERINRFMNAFLPRLPSLQTI